MIRGMVLRANDVPARHLFAACCYCCCTYSYSLLSVPFGGMFTDLVHKSVQLALAQHQQSTASSKVWSKDQPPPHSTDVLSLFQLCKMNWTGVGALEEEDSGRGLCFTITGWVPGCLLIVLQSVRSHYSYHPNSYQISPSVE